MNRETFNGQLTFEVVTFQVENYYKLKRYKERKNVIFKHAKQRLLFTQAWLQPVQSGYLYNFSPVHQQFLYDNVGRMCLTVESWVGRGYLSF